ncbi:MAG: hypothetical protein JWN48_5104, partial [Myxococcaceae bacterium]|nr:hypothetical protein [Myxococcaceae bacterium]
MHTRRFGNLSILGLLILSLAGCARCSDEPRVPFKLNPQAEPPSLPSSVLTDAATPTAQTFATAVDKLVLDGRPVAISHVRATLEVDLDGDGDRDVLALREDDAHKLQLLFATRDGEAYGAPRSVTGFVEHDLTGCSLAEPRFTALSSSKAALSLGITCADPAARLGPYSSLALLSLEAVPRSYERIDVIAADASGQPALRLSPHSVDADGDGHDDVGLTVTGSGAVEPDALELVYLDRPSGLVRDAREPETTLSAWAAAAQSQLGKEPEQAIARAELALTLQRAVCRELGTPVLALSGTPGVPCGTMKSTALLLVTLVGGYAKRGDLRSAFDAYRGLRRAEPRPSERELEKVSAALLKLPAEPGVTLRRGPAVEPVRAPRLHLPSARFLGDSTLYVHRLSPVLYDLERDEETAAPSASDQLLRDPSGQL